MAERRARARRGRRILYQAGACIIGINKPEPKPKEGSGSRVGDRGGDSGSGGDGDSTGGGEGGSGGNDDSTGGREGEGGDIATATLPSKKNSVVPM